MQVKIYTTQTCAYCQAEKDYLDEKGVKYEEVAVDTDPAAQQEMIAMSGQLGVPFTMIIHDDGKKEGVLGFDRPRLAQILGITG